MPGVCTGRWTPGWTTCGPASRSKNGQLGRESTEGGLARALPQLGWPARAQKASSLPQAATWRHRQAPSAHQDVLHRMVVARMLNLSNAALGGGAARSTSRAALHQAAAGLQACGSTCPRVCSPVHAGQHGGCPQGHQVEDDEQQGAGHPAPPRHRIGQACRRKGGGGGGWAAAVGGKRPTARARPSFPICFAHRARQRLRPRRKHELGKGREGMGQGEAGHSAEGAPRVGRYGQRLSARARSQARLTDDGQQRSCRQREAQGAVGKGGDTGGGCRVKRSTHVV